MTEILEILTKTTLILARALGSTETKARLSCCLSAKPFINLAHNACASVRSWLDIILVEVCPCWQFSQTWAVWRHWVSSNLLKDVFQLFSWLLCSGEKQFTHQVAMIGLARCQQSCPLSVSDPSASPGLLVKLFEKCLFSKVKWHSESHERNSTRELDGLGHIGAQRCCWGESAQKSLRDPPCHSHGPRDVHLESASSPKVRSMLEQTKNFKTLKPGWNARYPRNEQHISRCQRTNLSGTHEWSCQRLYLGGWMNMWEAGKTQYDLKALFWA